MDARLHTIIASEHVADLQRAAERARRAEVVNSTRRFRLDPGPVARARERFARLGARTAQTEQTP